jgi:regulator of RNase E activity RraA
MPERTEQALLELLRKFDTPTITNVLASYPHNTDTCLGLYDPWAINWYTDQSLKCIYPELGARAGHVVTAVYGMPDASFSRLAFTDILRAVDASPKPVVLCIRQDFPEHIKRKNGLAGGNMATALKSLNCIGIISDGPSRDIDEIRGMDFQYMLTGVCAGHGTFAVKAVNVPVSVCGMDVCPGELVHMDENGAVKFPRNQLQNVYDYACRLSDIEERRMKALASTGNLERILHFWAGQGY